MTPTLLRAALIVLAVAVLSTAGIFLWQWPRPVDAQDVLEDACADAEPAIYYDVVAEFIDGSFVRERHSMSVAETEAFEQSEWFHPDSPPSSPRSRAEIFYLLSTPVPQDDEGRSVPTPETVVTYTRQTDREGQWGEWVMEETPIVDESPISPRTDEEPQVFCGLLAEGYTDFTYDGEETVNGVRTKKFTLSRDVGEDTWQRVHWISLEGRRIQEEWLRPGSVFRWTYSGYGEVNTIPSAPDASPG